jgi:hypothetical protein
MAVMSEKPLVKHQEPNFFIVGASRSGTTSLANYLGQHPDIYLSPVKEPSHFIKDYPVAVHNYDEYLSLFKDAGNARAIGEASTAYLFDPDAAHAIHERFQDSKIIIILRNPIDMAVSLWRYLVLNGNETKSFEDAITPKEREYRKTEEFKKSCASWIWCPAYLYIERALYFNQVERYIKVFGRDHVKIYIFENFAQSPVKICQDIFTFLGVDNNYVPIVKILNESGELRFPMIKKLTDRLYTVLEPLLPLGLIIKLGKLRRIIITDNQKKTLINPFTRKTLEAIFRDDISKLESLLGYEIREWRSD